MKRGVIWLKSRRASTLRAAVIVLAGATLLLAQLGSLTPGASPRENLIFSPHQSINYSWRRALGLPFTLAQLLVGLAFHHHDLLISRLPAALVGLLTLPLFFWLLRRWYGLRVAALGVAMLGTSAWFLHVNRVATIDGSYALALVVLMLLCSFLHTPTRRLAGWYLCSLLLGLLLYMPGFVWLVAWLIYCERTNLVAAWRKLFKADSRGVSVGLFVVPLLPLAHALATNNSLLKPWLGLPARWPSALTWFKNCGLIVWHLFVHGYGDPLYNVGRLPLVGIFITVMFLIGLYFYGSRISASRSRWLAGLWLISSLLVALGGPVSLSLFLPLVFVVAAGGMGYLLQLWLKVFPLNPLARGLGLGLIIVALGFSAAYGLRQYFVAWPNDPAVRQSFSAQP